MKTQVAKAGMIRALFALAVLSWIAEAWPQDHADFMRPGKVAQKGAQMTADDAPGKLPGIFMNCDDESGWLSLSCWHLGFTGSKKPINGRLAKEGALFTDWYSRQSCTSGRAAFITGQYPLRTGVTRVGCPCAD